MLRKWLTSALLRTIFISFLVVSLIPLGLLGWMTTQSYIETRKEVVDQSRQGLEDKSFEILEARARSTAAEVANFLRERETDLKSLAELPHTEEAFLGFARGKMGTLWTVDESGKEKRFSMPLYREITWVDADGMEKIKVTNECSNYPFSCVVESSNNLVNVSDLSNTLFHNEDYFQQAMNLPQDKIYVGSTTGLYLPYETAFAGAQNRSGQRFRGVLYFAIPVYAGGKPEGVIVLALETLHLIEITTHVAPSNPSRQAEIDPREADFAYMTDPEGRVTSHPRHFNIAGVDENGNWVASISEENRSDPENLFRPGNLAEMGFIDPIYPRLVEANGRGEITSNIAAPLGRIQRAIASAPIPYYGGKYDNLAGFGMIIISTDGARFSLQATLMGKQIDNRVSELNFRLQLIGIGTVVVALILAVLLARSIAFPIINLTESSQQIELGEWDNANLDELGKKKGEDEVSRLSRVFASMADKLREREQKLRERVIELEIFIDETRRENAVAAVVETEFFVELTEKARKLRKQRQDRTHEGPDNAPDQD